MRQAACRAEDCQIGPQKNRQGGRVDLAARLWRSGSTNVPFERNRVSRDQGEMKPVRPPHQETVMSLDLRALIKETINFKCSLTNRRVFSAPRYNLECIYEKFRRLSRPLAE
jgi:hypothetical protein